MIDAPERRGDAARAADFDGAQTACRIARLPSSPASSSSACSTDAFLSPGNILNLLRQSAPMLIVAVAMTFVITTGGIDLSVGSTGGADQRAGGDPDAGWRCRGRPVVAGLLAGGALVGAVLGWFVAYQGIPSFIVTLAGLIGAARRGAAADPGLLDSDRGRTRLRCSSGAAGSWACRLPAAIAVLVVVAGLCRRSTQTRFGRQVDGGRRRTWRRRAARASPARRDGRLGLSRSPAWPRRSPASHRRPPRLGLLQRRRGLRAGGDRRRGAGRHLAVRRPRDDHRHGARRADHRRDRQRADPRCTSRRSSPRSSPALIILGGDLAEHARLSRALARDGRAMSELSPCHVGYAAR